MSKFPNREFQNTEAIPLNIEDSQISVHSSQCSDKSKTEANIDKFRKNITQNDNDKKPKNNPTNTKPNKNEKENSTVKQYKLIEVNKSHKQSYADLLLDPIAGNGEIDNSEDLHKKSNGCVDADLYNPVQDNLVTMNEPTTLVMTENYRTTQAGGTIVIDPPIVIVDTKRKLTKKNSSLKSSKSHKSRKTSKFKFK
jgi:E3 ubiquitin-protein ligase DOA10